MANSESTAVNALIDLVSVKPLRRDSDVDLFSLPIAPQVQAPASRSQAPVTRSVAESRFHNARVSPPISRTHAIPAIHRAVAIPAAPRESRPSNDETHAVVRPRPVRVSKLVLPMALVIAVGVLIGGYVAFDGEGRHAATSNVAVAPVATPATTAIAPAPTPTIAPAPTPAVATPAIAPVPAIAPAATAEPIAAPAVAPAPAVEAAPSARLADVLLESQPSGANVMMVDHGVNTTIGNTPIRISIDPSHEVDLVFTLANHTTRVEHLDPRTHNRLAIALDGTAPPPIAAVPHASTPKPTTVAVAPVHHHGGNGVLMISSKPPCAIFVDGKATGLMTPQRSMTLPAGNHQITLVNSEQKIKKTVGVQITTDHTTKLTRDLMKT